MEIINYHHYQLPLPYNYHHYDICKWNNSTVGFTMVYHIGRTSLGSGPETDAPDLGWGNHRQAQKVSIDQKGLENLWKKWQKMNGSTWCLMFRMFSIWDFHGTKTQDPATALRLAPAVRWPLSTLWPHAKRRRAVAMPGWNLALAPNLALKNKR